MKNPRHSEFETLRVRAVTLGRTGSASDVQELLTLLQSEFPTVRRAAAGALVKIFERLPSLAAAYQTQLAAAVAENPGGQSLQYLLKAFLLCAETYSVFDLQLLSDLARNPAQKDYVRTAAAEALAAGEAAARAREARLRHWCTRCQRPISREESARGIEKYGKPYCRHCLDERILEDANFNLNVEAAKRLRTTDGTAVQSQGERRIGNWLAAHAIAYRYDERMVVAGDIAIRPDFYLPEFDIYIEYWGMDTPEYRANMEKKRFLYQRDRRKLVSLSFRDLNNLEKILSQKLSRYIHLPPQS